MDENIKKWILDNGYVRLQGGLYSLEDVNRRDIKGQPMEIIIPVDDKLWKKIRG